jgi:hypothetical protein
MSHLAARVDTCVGPAGHRDSRRLGQRQCAPERLLDCLLNCRQARLGRPAMER